MADFCLKCKNKLTSWMHGCDGYRLVHDLSGYHEDRRTTNPLDWLSLKDRQEILLGQEEADATALRQTQIVNQEMEALKTAYFQSPLVYRIEFDSLSIEPDFRPKPEGSAVVVEGPTAIVWQETEDHINGLATASFLLLNENEEYLCRLVSYDETGWRYLWGARLLSYQVEAGWTFSEWG